VLHVGGKKNPLSQAQGFGKASFIQRNFVDGGFQILVPILNKQTNGSTQLQSQSQSNPITTLME
jgi:hypothetical protein